MLIKTLELGPLQTNCYIVSDADTLDCAVIDPGDESNVVLDYLESNNLKCRYVFLTHGHFDHTMAVGAVQEATGATVCIHRLDAEQAAANAEYGYTPEEGTTYYAEGDSFQVGGLKFDVMETPGHTLGGVTLICENALFTGDTMFRDSCGRTDFPGGDMKTLLKSLKRICDLPGDYEVYPGHMQSTTLDRERKFNYYVKYAYTG